MSGTTRGWVEARDGVPRLQVVIALTAAAGPAANILLAAVAFGAWYGNRQVWFLGTDGAGRVALYRGLPYDLPFGIQLYDLADAAGSTERSS